MSVLQVLAWVALLSLLVGTAWVLAAEFWPCPCGCGNPLHKHSPLRSHR